MGEDKDELSDEEYAALLRDLEGRADSGGGKKKKKKGQTNDDDDVEDIDAFLQSLESEDSSQAKKKKKTATTDGDDDLAREFASLQEKGELTASAKPKKSGKTEKASKKAGQEKTTDKEEETGSEERSRGKRAALFALQTVFWFLPAVVLLWVVGTYLGQWVSAGWLIAAISAVFVFGLPVLFKKLVKRGSYRPWLFGASLVVTVALVAPMPNLAGQNMAHYGHWPASMIAEVVGADSDSNFVVSNASAAGLLGGVVSTSDGDWEARQLGTIFPLGMDWPPSEDIIPLLEGDIVEEPSEPLQTGDVEEATEAPDSELEATTGEAQDDDIDSVVETVSDAIEDAAKESAGE